MKKLSLLACSLFLFAFSCEKEQINCSGEPTPIPSEPLTAVNSPSDCRIQNTKDGANANLVIQSQAAYEKYGFCTGSLPAIDFSKKTLLAGKYVAPDTDWVESQRVYQNCDGNIVFEVKLARGGYTAVTDVYYFAIIPKISGNTPVTFDVSYQN